jgi:hypothetical protein
MFWEKPLALTCKKAANKKIAVNFIPSQIDEWDVPGLSVNGQPVRPGISP